MVFRWTTQMKIHTLKFEHAQKNTVGDVFQLDQASISINVQAEAGDTQTYASDQHQKYKHINHRWRYTCHKGCRCDPK